MIHGYHVIMPCYGFWLPNDPRGSWSDFVGEWELAKFGRSTKSIARRATTELSRVEIAQREAARKELKHPPVELTGEQALSVSKGFATQITKSGYTVWACAILPEHTHMVIARHTYKVEQIVNLMKGAATRQLIVDDLHPLALRAENNARPPQMWAEHQWKVYLDSESAIEAAINYVEENPEKENQPRQHWSFVTPFQGLDVGWVTYH